MNEQGAQMKLRKLLFLGLLTAAIAMTTACAGPSGRSPANITPLEQEARALIDSVEINYGPLQLKRQTVGLDWDAVKATFMNDVKTAKTSREVYMAMVRFFASLKDAHVSITIPSTYKIAFDLQFMNVGGSTLLNYLGSQTKAKSGCQAVAGDELVSIEGKTIPQLFAMLDPYLHVGNERSTRALQVYGFSNWTEKNTLVGLARKDANGQTYANFSFRARKTGAAFDCAIPAAVSGNPLVSYPIDAQLTDAAAMSAARAELQRQLELTRAPKAPAARQAWVAQLPISVVGRKTLAVANRAIELQQKLVDTSLPNIDAILAEANSFEGAIAQAPIKIGQNRPYFKLPKGFNRINGFGAGLPIVGKPFNGSTGLFAGTFKRGEKKIGFIRIPSYMPKSNRALMFANMSLRSLLAQMEKNTDELIIDQTHNPGGAVIYSDWIVGALVGNFEPAKHMHFVVRPRGDWLSTYSSLAIELKKIEEQQTQAEAGQARKPKASDVYLKTTYLDQVQAQYETVFKAYSRGDFMSAPVSLYLTSEYLRDTIDSVFMRLEKGDKKKFLGGALEVLYPFHGDEALTRGQAYTKPVYMMIDELDFSGGDATPAILQDYGRVKLVGVNTSGAGGTVEEFETHGTFPIGYHLTSSLMMRSGSRTVENVGIHPDIDFELTDEDVADGFTNSFERLLNQLGV